jgi:hypothetical protein
MRFGKTARACACALIALAVVGTSVAPAAAKSPKKTVAAKAHPANGKTKKTAKTSASAAKTDTTSTGAASAGLCHLGQDPKTCTANPLFGKTDCDTFNADLQALAAPGVTVGEGYQPATGPNGVDCFWKINGSTQSIGVHIYGGKNFQSTIYGFGKKEFTLQQVFEWNYQQWVDQSNGNDCPIPTLADAQAGDAPPPFLGPQKTTIQGHEAWTMDSCAETAQPDSPQYNPNSWVYRYVNVLDDDMVIEFYMRAPLATDATTAQMIPTVEKWMAAFASTK